MSREVAFAGKTKKTLERWPQGVREIVLTNLQALQGSHVSAFSDLPDWINEGKVTEKALSGNNLKGARQLTIKCQNSYRVVYVAEFSGVVVVLHCFTKQTEGRQSKDIDTIEKRLKDARSEFS